MLGLITGLLTYLFSSGYTLELIKDGFRCITLGLTYAKIVMINKVYIYN